MVTHLPRQSLYCGIYRSTGVSLACKKPRYAARDARAASTQPAAAQEGDASKYLLAMALENMACLQHVTDCRLSERRRCAQRYMYTVRQLRPFGAYALSSSFLFPLPSSLFPLPSSIPPESSVLNADHPRVVAAYAHLSRGTQNSQRVYPRVLRRHPASPPPQGGERLGHARSPSRRILSGGWRERNSLRDRKVCFTMCLSHLSLMTRPACSSLSLRPGRDSKSTTPP